MILVEADDDLAGCVADFFRDQFDVFRVETFREALRTLRERETSMLFADVGSEIPEQVPELEALKRDHPALRIVLTYLAPLAEETWERKLGELAHVLVRKPYSVLEVDRSLRDLDETRKTDPA